MSGDLTCECYLVAPNYRPEDHLSSCPFYPSQNQTVRPLTPDEIAKGFDNPLEVNRDVEGYEDLDRILDEAYKQAANGKGKERHGVKGENWSNQPIIRHQKAYGAGFALGQCSKKLEESMALPIDKAKFELLGAIVYVAAAYRFLELQEEEKKCPS